MVDDWFENNKEFYNYLIKNMVYCEDTHSVAHRLYDKILEKVIKKIYSHYSVYNLTDDDVSNQDLVDLNKEELEKHITYKDVQFMMNDVLNEIADEFDKGDKYGNV